MFKITWQVDEELLSKFTPKTQNMLIKRANQSVIKDIDDISVLLKEVQIVIYNCFYCKRFNLEFVPDKSVWVTDICPMCGEVSPYHKIESSLSKTRSLIEITQKLISKDGTIHDEEKNRTLLEQSIVTIATGIEIFLRDIYAIILNIRYVKDNKSLYDRFLRDGRNEFTNMDKANKKFKNDLTIDLKKIILGEDNFKKLNLLMNKRHVIVHNAGIVDKSFLKQSGIECKEKKPVPLDWNEIKKIIDVVEFLLKKINVYFDNDIGLNLIMRSEKEIPKKLKYN